VRARFGGIGCYVRIGVRVHRSYLIR
jgi:hypothetical protein